MKRKPQTVKEKSKRSIVLATLEVEMSEMSPTSYPAREICAISDALMHARAHLGAAALGHRVLSMSIHEPEPAKPVKKRGRK